MNKSSDSNKRNWVALYGTLRRGGSNFRLLDNPESKYITTGTVAGFRMHSLGGFPGIIPDKEAKPIVAELFEVSDTVLKSLDRLEGHPNFYTRTSAELVDKAGAKFPMEIYVFNSNGRGMGPLIENGDWMEYAKTHKRYY